jgi:hypothetical protein
MGTENFGMETTNDALQKIRLKRDDLLRQISELDVAEKVLLELHSTAPDSLNGSLPSRRKKAKSLSSAVREALFELGKATSAEIIEHIQQHYTGNASRDSVRSILSMMKSAKPPKISRDELTGKWSSIMEDR